MKKLFGLLMLLMFAFATQVQAQVGKQVGDPSTYLTVEQLAKYNNDIRIAEAKIATETTIAALEKRLETYGEWVGVGGEVGLAVREALMAVVDVAEKFGNTKVGEFTMLMVGWKIMGEDVIRIMLGLILILAYILILTPLYKRQIYSRKVKIGDDGWFKYPKKYEIIRPSVSGDNAIWLTIVFILGLFISTWITYGIMFAG